MGILRRDAKANIDPQLLAQVRGCRMRQFSEQETFNYLRELYQRVSDSKLWEAINAIYED